MKELRSRGSLPPSSSILSISFSDASDISCTSSSAAGAVPDSGRPRMMVDFVFLSGHRQ